MNDQEQFWSGSFGDEYTKRNRVDWRARIPFWHDIMKFTGARSVYEVGCGAGFNLSAIREASPHEVALWGCDISELASRQARVTNANIMTGMAGDCLTKTPTYELILTAGVLIHVAPDNLPTLMQQIISASSRYVLAIEYASEVEEMVEYRGVRDRLWRRPYGNLYEQLGLTILHQGEATGWENTQYWLMEKP